MIDRPIPPAGHKANADDTSVASLRAEIRRAQEDIAELKGLLLELKERFSQLKGG